MQLQIFKIEYGLFNKCAPNLHSDVLVTLGNTSAKSNKLECTIAYNDIESRFLNHVFYINFDQVNRQK